MPAWNLYLIKHTRCLEQVQRFALRVCTKSWNTNYEDLLARTNLPSLTQRRLLLKLCFLYQLVNHLSLCNHVVPPRALSVNVRSSNIYLLDRHFCRTCNYDHSFFSMHGFCMEFITSVNPFFSIFVLL